MLHLACGGQNAKSRWFLDNALSRGVEFDLIGQSYYPRWHGTHGELRANLMDLARRYSQGLVVVEYSAPDQGEVNEIIRSLPGGKGYGSCIWEPTEPRHGNLFDSAGRALPGLQDYREFNAPAVCRLRWGEPQTVARGGWGRMVRLPNTNWLAVSTHFERNQSTLEIRESRPGFDAWDRQSEVVEPGRFLDNGELAVLEKGQLLLTGRSVVEGESYRLPVYRSGDGGRNWSRAGDIDSSEGPKGTMKGRGLWEPHFFFLSDGRLAVAYANEKHSTEKPGYSQVCSERISKDDGQSWGPELMLASQPGGGSLRPGMPVVTRMSDGRFIAVYEVVGVGDADVFFKISADGEHWEEGLGQRAAGHHAGPWLVSLSDGRLLLTSCANTISCSHDFGLTWHSIEPAPWNVGRGKVFTWPALYETAPGRLVSVIARRGVQLREGAIQP
jgi:hypothetical protein